MSPFLAAAPATLEEALRRSEIVYSRPWQGGLFVMGLIWAVWVLLNFWIWSKTKALANLLMMVGSGALALAFILNSFNSGPEAWFHILALLTLSAGFFLSVRPLIDAQLKALQAKLHAATSKKEPGTTPPTAPPPAQP